MSAEPSAAERSRAEAASPWSQMALLVRALASEAPPKEPCDCLCCSSSTRVEEEMRRAREAFPILRRKLRDFSPKVRDEAHGERLAKWKDCFAQNIGVLEEVEERTSVYPVPTSAQRDSRLFKAKLGGLLALLKPFMRRDPGWVWPCLLPQIHKGTSPVMEQMVFEHDPHLQLVKYPSYRFFVEGRLLGRRISGVLFCTCEAKTSWPMERRGQCACPVTTVEELENLVARELIFWAECVAWYAKDQGLEVWDPWEATKTKRAADKRAAKDAWRREVQRLLSIAQNLAEETISKMPSPEDLATSSQGLSKAQLKRRAKKAAADPGPAQFSPGPAGDRAETAAALVAAETPSSTYEAPVTSRPETAESEATGEEEDEEGEEGAGAEVQEEGCAGDAGAGDWGWVAVGGRKRTAPNKSPPQPPLQKTSPEEPPAEAQVGESKESAAVASAAVPAEKWSLAEHTPEPPQLWPSDYAGLAVQLARIARQARPF